MEINNMKIESFTLELRRESPDLGCFTVKGQGFDQIEHITITDVKNRGLCISLSQDRSSSFNDSEAIYEDITVREDAEAANAHIKVTVNGRPVPIRSLRLTMSFGHLTFFFYLDCSTRKHDLEHVVIAAE